MLVVSMAMVDDGCVLARVCDECGHGDAFYIDGGADVVDADCDDDQPPGRDDDV